MRVRMTSPHEPPERPAIAVQRGQVVAVGALDATWPAFRWCITASGTGGWVPDRLLERISEGRARVRSSYNTRELAATAGEILDVLEEDRESGWLWCQSAAGEMGWVPVTSTETVGGAQHTDS